MSFINILVIIGIFLSIYAINVKRKSARSKQYKALCDINDKISCSKAFSSREGSILGLPNPIYGVLFYLLVLILYQSGFKILLFYMVLIACLGTLFLAYVLYFRQKNFCIVCTMIYLINILLLITSYANMNIIV